jgi:Amt family ammonium transporter
VLAAIVYSGIGTYVILKAVGAIIPLRATLEDETIGMDLSHHGEEAYIQAGGSDMA